MSIQSVEPHRESQSPGESAMRDVPPGGELFSQKIYWLNKLAGEIPESNLITDFLRPVERENDYGEIEFVIPETNSRRILRLTNNSYLSVYVLLVAVAKVMLSNYTRSRDVIVGSPVYRPGGPDHALNKVVALRSEIVKDASFKEFLLQAKKTVVEAYANQDFPFDELVQLLKLPRNSNRCPLFDVLIRLDNIHNSKHARDLANDITFSFRINLGSIEGRAVYNQALFTSASIENAVSLYLHVLGQVVEDINLKVDEISLLRESEARQILSEFNDNARDYPVHKTLQDLFERQAETTPQNIAVNCEGEHLSYSQLNERANRIARLLEKTGSARRDFVGILDWRGIDFLTGMFAIFKAGCAYVPVDPAYPHKRVQYMLSNSAVSTVLTRAPLVREFHDILAGCPSIKNIICFDGVDKSALTADAQQFHLFGKADFEGLPSGNLRAASSSSDPAYMIYTSGSTGVPKGVIIRHDGAVNHIYAQFEALNFNEEFSFLQSAPSSSDISVWQFLAPVLIGGRTVVVDNETVADAKELFHVIKQERISIVELVPAVLKNLLDYVSTLSVPERELRDLKWMMPTGESLPVELANRWLRIYPQIKVVNCYGPTEASDDISQFIVEAPLPANSKSVPIGTSLANLDIYILDQKMRLVPPGVPGEICVSGIGVGDGYWKNEEKTKSAFVPNPFPGAKGNTIFKTGDLGRWLPDHNILFLGRIDRQVKVRGFRIELEEIESVLAQHPAVRDAVVAVRQDSAGEQRLVGYLVLSDGSDPKSEIREYLKVKLPEHMVPSVLMSLDELPRTPSGKVDHNRLPEPVLKQKSEQPALKSKSPIEEMLAGVWIQVLRIEEVGPDDNFFDLGGHSLLATQVVSRIRDMFKIELPLRVFFEKPTIAQLAESVEKARETSGEMRAPQMRPVPRDIDLPLSFAQQRLWFLDRLSPGNPFYNLTTAMQLVGKLNVEALERSISEIVRRHEILRTRFEAIKGKPYQRILPPHRVRLPVIDLSHLEEPEKEERARLLAVEEGARPFDLTRGPMLRVALLKLSEEVHLVLFSLHHIVSDGWSTSVLVGELEVLYDAYCEGRPSPLPELAIQYADFAVWQREWLEAGALEAQLSYWRKQLGGDLPPFAMPTDRPRPPIQTYRGTIYAFALPSELSKAVKEFSRREGVTLFMTLLAGFQILLNRYSGQEDIVVGADVANRNRSEIEGLIGFFVNMLVMRLDLSGNPTFREVLRRVREMTLDAITHQDVPFEKLVEELQPKRDLSRSPLFQGAFVLQNTPDETIEISGLTMCPMDLPAGSSKFDMVLSMTEEPERCTGFVEYNTDLFDANTIVRFVRHYENVLRQMSAGPDQTIEDFRLLEDDETKGLDVSLFPDAELSQADFESLLLNMRIPPA